MMVDANQVWDVPEAITWMKKLASFKPWFIEEPTAPDDVLGHLAIANAMAPLGILVATGEHCANRILFKQFITSGAIGICQIDACRVGGVNEVMSIILMAAKVCLLSLAKHSRNAHFTLTFPQHGIPVCPHAGGVGLCELVQHLSMFDFVCVSGTMDGRRLISSRLCRLHVFLTNALQVDRACGSFAPAFQRPNNVRSLPFSCSLFETKTLFLIRSQI